MHFLTEDEARAWCGDAYPTHDGRRPTRPRDAARWVRGPIATTVIFARMVEQALRPREACLLWVTETGIWRSSENLHLYYRLRQSYGDTRQLHEAPAHLFLDYEADDLVSFIQLATLNGWDAHILPTVGYASAFVSHDEFIEFVANEAADLTAFADGLGGSEICTRPASS